MAGFRWLPEVQTSDRELLLDPGSWISWIAMRRLDLKVRDTAYGKAWVACLLSACLLQLRDLAPKLSQSKQSFVHGCARSPKPPSRRLHEFYIYEQFAHHVLHFFKDTASFVTTSARSTPPLPSVVAFEDPRLRLRHHD
jgi:hypothetical protein